MTNRLRMARSPSTGALRGSEGTGFGREDRDRRFLTVRGPSEGLEPPPSSDPPLTLRSLLVAPAGVWAPSRQILGGGGAALRIGVHVDASLVVEAELGRDGRRARDRETHLAGDREGLEEVGRSPDPDRR